jgi:hypothetical protein
MAYVIAGAVIVLAAVAVLAVYFRVRRRFGGKRILRDADLVSRVLEKSGTENSDRRIVRLLAAYRAEKARARLGGPVTQQREAARALLKEFRSRRRRSRSRPGDPASVK